MGVIEVDGFGFKFEPSACETCPGYCCCGESGNVWVSQQEMNLISEFMKMHLVDFIDKYLYHVGNGYSCKERATGRGLECIFFQGIEKKCSIYAVRPSGCRTYPFWDHFKNHFEMLVKECPGVMKG